MPQGLRNSHPGAPGSSPFGGAGQPGGVIASPGILECCSPSFLKISLSLSLSLPLSFFRSGYGRGLEAFPRASMPSPCWAARSVHPSCFLGHYLEGTIRFAERVGGAGVGKVLPETTFFFAIKGNLSYYICLSEVWLTLQYT